ncbi:hypothetical protein BHE74_00030876 [Ensete ventricosum]|nr:hypothetical protein BHE74_00030876 [Ensete ventricosum]
MGESFLCLMFFATQASKKREGKWSYKAKKRSYKVKKTCKGRNDEKDAEGRGGGEKLSEDSTVRKLTIRKVNEDSTFIVDSKGEPFFFMQPIWCTVEDDDGTNGRSSHYNLQVKEGKEDPLRLLLFLGPQFAAGVGAHCAYVGLITATANAFMSPAILLAIGDRIHRVKPEVMATPPGWTPFPTSLAYRRHEALQVLHDMFELRGSGVPAWVFPLRVGDVVVMRSCPELELEPELLSLLGWLCGKPVLPLGHFPPAAMNHDAAGSFTDGNDVFRWLGNREVG